MAQKTLRQFSAPSNSHIPTGLNNYQGTDGFEIKTGLVNMIQASPFCGKALEDAHAHLQNFLEVSSIINPKGTTMDNIHLRLSTRKDVVLCLQGRIRHLRCMRQCFFGQVLSGGQNQCPMEHDF